VCGLLNISTKVDVDIAIARMDRNQKLNSGWSGPIRTDASCWCVGRCSWNLAMLKNTSKKDVVWASTSTLKSTLHVTEESASVQQ
jgi:hypothetical protein